METMTAKDTAQLEQLQAKWQKAKSKLQKQQAKELDLRNQISGLLAKRDLSSLKTYDESKTVQFTYTRKKNYSITKLNCVAIKSELEEETFDKLFNVSYKLKEAAYNLLEKDSPSKKKIDAHLTIKDSPLSVTVKELD